MAGYESEHRFALQGFTFQSLGEIDPINYMILRVTHVHHFKNRGVEVVCLNSGLVIDPGLVTPGQTITAGTRMPPSRIPPLPRAEDHCL